MNTSDIIKKAWEKYPEKPIYDDHSFIPLACFEDENKDKREGYIAAMEEVEKLHKIHGWVARDSKLDPLFGLGLCIHYKKPNRLVDCWEDKTILMHLDWDLYPDLKWEDEPKEVEIILRDI